MQLPTIKQKQQLLTCPQLPLGVYREIAAHLRQVEGVEANPIMRSIEHDESETFDYYQSQIAALQINYAENIKESAQQQIEEILNYYAQRYNPWLENTTNNL